MFKTNIIIFSCLISAQVWSAAPTKIKTPPQPETTEALHLPPPKAAAAPNAENENSSLNITLAKGNFWEHAAPGYIFFLNENFEEFAGDEQLEHIEKNYYPGLRTILKNYKFEGKKGDEYVLTLPDNKDLKQFIFIGLGAPAKKDHHNLETLRRAIGNAIQTLKKRGIKKAILELPDEAAYKISSEELLKQLCIAAFMASYEFIEFKSNKETTVWHGDLAIRITKKQKANFDAALQEATLIGQAINQARRWSDLPGNVHTPTFLSLEAEKIAKERKLPYTIFGKERAEELGMGGFLGVGAGSRQESKFVVLEYKAAEKDAPTLALVGKGITFDTGGISLKPRDYMHGMKYDMCGAAAVIATMNIIAQLKPSINVIGLTPLVENMPDGAAQRQDDIIRFMNGKTAEIRNTDAEGRLVLADALCYAERFYKPETIIDIATLTGACKVALGHFFTGLMTQDDTLLEVLPKIGAATGDRTWPLPLDEDFKEANHSPVADVRNSGAPEFKAGAIAAACFLQEFVKNARWAHLDIAGTAHDGPGISYLGKGATGAGIRLLVEFVMNYQKHMEKSINSEKASK